MIRLPQQKACFVHIPKTGGDFISAFLSHKVPGAHFVGPGKHWPASVHKAVPNFQFAFVREPVSWFRSYYAFITQHYISVYGEYPNFEPGMWHCMRCFEKYDYSTFESFVQDVYQDQPSFYTRMVEWFTGPPDAQVMDFIGKQETLNRDLGMVLQKLKLGHLAGQIPSKRKNTSKSDFKVPKHIGLLIESQERPIYRRFNYNTKYL